MSAHFRDAADLISVAAARAACASAGADLRTSWYVAHVGLGIPGKRLSRMVRTAGSIIRTTVRAIEDHRDAADVDAALTRIERRAARWAA